MEKPERNGKSWTAEARRQERKNRLASRKGGDGRLHAKRKGRSLKTWLAIAAVVVVLIGVLVYAVVTGGIPQRALALMTIDGQKVSVAAFNYWHGNVLSQYGLNPNSPELDTTLSTDEDGTETSVRQYLLSITATQLQRIFTEASLAREAGIELGEYATAVDRQVESIIQAAGSAGYADMMLKETYGPGCTLGVVRNLYETLYLSTKYAAVKSAETIVTAETLSQYYEENKDDIDTVTYRAFSFPYVVSATATDAEKEQAKTAAKKKADDFLTGVKSELDFKKLALEATDEQKRKEYEEKDGSLISDITSTGLTMEVGEWVYDAARKAGDTSIIETSSDYTVVSLQNRDKPNSPQASARPPPIEADRETPTADEHAAAKAKADALLAAITDEASFIEMVKTDSDDVASVASGGLFTGLDENSSYVKEFLTWATDDERKVGDTGVVQTEYGYHVMYFVGHMPAWENTVRDKLVIDGYEEYITDLLENDSRFDYSFHSFAQRFIH